ncbi:ion transporter [Teredinibacter waterburyi]|jgi:Ion transport protein.|uniref:ion transporter n=1 Tax=Teredinibacter waterburyi TaxID=1500538 RepID=UPI00165FB14D|nr:ion transporter [Teredinibacter waterburyi]
MSIEPQPQPSSESNEFAPTLRFKLYTIIFGTSTPAGKRFDLVLIYLIVFSVLALMLDSIRWVSDLYGPYIFAFEWLFTILFTAEYLVRVYCSPKRWAYVFSFYGLVDLISILPSYVSLFVPGANFLLAIRLLRVLRIFRILKLVRYLSEANVLIRAVMMSRRKISIFAMSVLVLSVIFGSLMYIVEGPENGFSSIPKSIYWTIVTITTVGYGDITPHTVLGQIIAATAMLTGYSILAVPTGIFTAELAQEMQRDRRIRNCINCSRSGHEADSKFCRFCGAGMEEKSTPESKD